MKSLNLKFLQRKNNYIYFFLLLTFFLLFIFVNKEKLFQNFNPVVVSNYLRSQDILDSNNVIKDRIFVSDEDIYIASGYLYVNRSSPIDYNFQHPPFIKYLFGLSSKYLNLPLLPNIIFAGILLLEIYFIGKVFFKSELIGFIASLLLLVDPVFKEVTIYALLDLGQMVFMLGFIISTLHFKKNYLLQGILLGLAMASKFYSPVIVFLLLIYLYKIIIKELNIRKELLVLLFGFVTFSLCYIRSFPFNIFFEQAKIIKFMLDHNHAVEWGAVLKMFFSGYIIWPIAFFINLFYLTKLKDNNLLFVIIPILYLFVMTFQLPFTRYFILILPFMYLNFANTLYNSYGNIKHKI